MDERDERYQRLMVAADRMMNEWRTSVDEFCGASEMWRAIPPSQRSQKLAAILARMDRRTERRKAAWHRLIAARNAAHEARQEAAA